MNLLIKVLYLCLCVYSINCIPFLRTEPKLDDLQRIFENVKTNLKSDNGLEVKVTEDSKITNTLRELPTANVKSQAVNETELSRAKRQLAVPLGFRSYDYGDYYGGLTGDYNYDYYDWVCSETGCQLCNILGGECCDPDGNPNCFLPDTCLNNPCLAGGSCVTTRTIHDQPDFLCICLPGLTGKYCQITNDYVVDGFLPNIPIGPAFPPHGPFPPRGPPGGPFFIDGGAPPQPGYPAPYQQAPAPYQPSPAPYLPEPAQYQPAPTQYQPAPPQYQPEPQPQAPSYPQPQAPSYPQPQAPSYQQQG